MHKTIVINAVGLTCELIGEHTPNLARFLENGALSRISPILPAVTCSMQATYLTGKPPRDHGIVGNGWYFRDTSEIRFWQQSDRLVQSPRIWDIARAINPNFTCANLFWWHAMYSGANITVTPRPMYPSDGRKLPDIWTNPPALRASLQRELGQFPLFRFWGPATSIESTRWIADAAIRVDHQFDPTLTLVYLPHLDYVLQREGPWSPNLGKHLRDLDDVVGMLLEHAHARSARVVVLSEYGIEAANQPIHINRMLRERGWLALRDELGKELLDPGASRAFAIADHQIAHVHVNDSSIGNEVREALESLSGVADVLDHMSKPSCKINHDRAGDLVCVAKQGAWFTYYYWMDELRAPDFATTVDIHRKPGYDPVELFVDPAIRFPKLQIGMNLLKRRLGFRSLMKLISTDATLVRGTHGRITVVPLLQPVLIQNRSSVEPAENIHAVNVLQVLLDKIF